MVRCALSPAKLWPSRRPTSNATGTVISFQEYLRAQYSHTIIGGKTSCYSIDGEVLASHSKIRWRHRTLYMVIVNALIVSLYVHCILWSLRFIIYVHCVFDVTWFVRCWSWWTPLELLFDGTQWSTQRNPNHANAPTGRFPLPFVPVRTDQKWVEFHSLCFQTQCEERLVVHVSNFLLSHPFSIRVSQSCQWWGSFPNWSVPGNRTVQSRWRG